ncbi:MAG: DNA repair protein RecN [Cyclobacteriaceae bacterium]|nr:MAG: DNA repair protein RecN [Cyclobacteriaceae bacterium]
MLKHLTIKNYALIRHLEMEPSGHLNVITGETGAGKSIMLGALGLLMGNRADTKVLWDEQEKCITEGIFLIKPYNLKSFFKAEDLDYDNQTVIRREISPSGKSRAFINDTPVTLDVLRKLGALLMDVHSQHETLMLGDKNFQLKLVDAYAGNQSLLEQYQEAWQQFVQSKKEYELLQLKAESLRQESDFINFQLDELVKASFEPGEQEKLESELKIMEHAEDIKSRFNAILDLLSRSEYTAQQALTEARNQLQAVADYSKAYETLADRLQSNIIELDDILNEIETAEVAVEFDPQRAEAAKDRIDLLYRLLKKHRVNSIDELLTLQEEFQQKANLTANLDDELAKAKADLDQKTKQMQALAEKLSKARTKIFESLCKEITHLLNEVGIPQASLRIEHARTTPTNYGADSLDLLFSANKGIAPRPLGDVASGGEFSRLMFCIKYVMAEKTEMPTLVLDEIDTGVSGEIAIKLGKLMKAMAKKHQLITISHLPQIAAKADTHYFVFKDNSSKKTISSIKRLSEQERVEEIAKMIGGEKPSKVAVENARELLVN